MSVSAPMSAEKDLTCADPASAPAHVITLAVPIESGVSSYTSMSAVEVDFVVDTLNASNINITKGKCTKVCLL